MIAQEKTAKPMQGPWRQKENREGSRHTSYSLHLASATGSPVPDDAPEDWWVPPHTPDGCWLVADDEREALDAFECKQLHELRLMRITMAEEAKSSRIAILELRDEMKQISDAIEQLSIGGAA